MKKVAIITDNYSGISKEEAKELGVKVLTLPFFFGEECFYEGVSISREAFFERLNSGEQVSTTQPSPDALMDIWREGLKEAETVLYIPLSSGLSGSCNTAMIFAQEEEFEDKVFVADIGRIATPMHRSILDALELAKEGYSAKEIKDILEASKEEMSIYIAVETLEFLKRGGRITPAAAAVGSLLNIKPILKLNVGVLDSYMKCRGFKKAKREMLAAMKRDLETKFFEASEKGEVYLMAASSADETATKEWVEEIKEYFPGMDVLCDPLCLGIACHTGEGALGIGCSCKPKRV